MGFAPMNELLDVAIQAAKAAGKLIRDNFGTELHVNEMKTYDIKLELDVRSQTLITEMMLARFPDHAVLGEEGGASARQASSGSSIPSTAR
jgi:myo-inositol-1(or 4)-monophosphatase